MQTIGFALNMSNRDFVRGECRHCAGHVEFPAEAIGQTVPCPHCGQPTELAVTVPPGKTLGSRRLWLGIGVAVGLAAAGLAGALWWRQKVDHGNVSDAKPPATAQSNTPAISTASPVVPAEAQIQVVTNDFALLPFKLEKTPGSSLVYVTGTIRNLSDRQRFGVKVIFGLLDTNDNGIGAATDYQSVFDPHAAWRFRAMVMESKAASARFTSILEDQ